MFKSNFAAHAAALLLLASCGDETNGSSDVPSAETRVDGVSSAALASAKIVLDRKIAKTPRGSFTLTKYVDTAGEFSESVQDAQGREVGREILAGERPGIVGDRLLERLSRRKDESVVDVDIALRDLAPQIPVQSVGNVAGRHNMSTVSTARLNGKAATLGDLVADRAIREQRLASARVVRQAERRGLVTELAARGNWKLSSEDIEQLADAQGSITRSMALSEVEQFATANADLIAAVELHAPSADDTLATAMADTSADPGAADLLDSSGNGIGVFLTEDGCPPAGYLTRYTRLSGSDTDHSRNTTAILRAVAPWVYIYCRGGAALPTSSQLLGSNFNPRVHLISRSNSARDGSAAYQTLDRDWDNFIYNNGVLIIQSAGNNGNTGYVGSPGKGLNVLTVGDYNDGTDTINGSSSGLDPTNTHNTKPELSAPGELINAGTTSSGTTITKSGTSQATPHVAGLVADATDADPWHALVPALTKAHTIASATDAIAGNPNYIGEGGVDYLSGYWDFHDFWWNGSNADFTSWAANDDNSSSSSLDANFSLSAGQTVRAVLAWINRGTWTYDHRADASPIGIDLDLLVTGPSGGLVAVSSTADDPYEIVNFTALETGTYQFSIRRWANRDTSCRSDIGLTINWN